MLLPKIGGHFAYSMALNGYYDGCGGIEGLLLKNLEMCNFVAYFSSLESRSIEIFALLLRPVINDLNSVLQIRCFINLG